MGQKMVHSATIYRMPFVSKFGIGGVKAGDFSGDISQCQKLELSMKTFFSVGFFQETPNGGQISLRICRKLPPSSASAREVTKNTCPRLFTTHERRIQSRVIKKKNSYDFYIKVKKTAVETLTFWGKIPMKKISNKHVISNGMSYGSSYLSQEILALPTFQSKSCIEN